VRHACSVLLDSMVMKKKQLSKEYIVKYTRICVHIYIYKVLQGTVVLELRVWLRKVLRKGQA
jgi:hypothetical protein